MCPFTMWRGIALKKGRPVSESPHLLLCYQTKSFIHSSLSEHVLNSCVPSLCQVHTDDGEMHTELKGRERHVNSPLHMPPQGQQKRQGRTVTQESSWFTHRRAKRYQRRLPGGGNPHRAANPQLKHKQDTEAWIYKQCNLAPPSRDTMHDHTGWIGLCALLLVPSSRILKLWMATFPGPLLMQPQWEPGENYTPLTFPVFWLVASPPIISARARTSFLVSIGKAV